MIKVDNIKGLILIETDAQTESVMDHVKGEYRSFMYLSPLEASRLYYQLQWAIMDEEIKKFEEPA